jgi:threonine synthase
VQPNEQIVVLVTGHGLKDVDAALKNIEMPDAIEANEAALAGVAKRLSSIRTHR